MATTTAHEWATRLATAARYRKAAGRHVAKASDWIAKAELLEAEAAGIRARLEDEQGEVVA